MTFEEFKTLNNKARGKGEKIKIDKIENDFLYIKDKIIVFEEFLEEIKNKNIFCCNPNILKTFKGFKKEFSIGTFVYNINYGIEVSGVVLKKINEENYLIQYKDFHGYFWTEESNIDELL